MLGKLTLVLACAAAAMAFAPCHPGSPPLSISSASIHSAAKERKLALSMSVRSSSEETCKLLQRSAVNKILLGTLLAMPTTSFAEDVDDEKIRAGYATLVDLIENWTKYAGSGDELNGDNVRRQVGTVGNKSPLLGIRKALLRKQVDIDLFEEFDKSLQEIDSNAYSAIFADTSTAPKRGYEYMNDAKRDAERTLEIYKKIMDSLGLKP
ncbi:hypothetical protein GUITHDRAFT_163075 [Guillardia theta CCMP2712]|uniref:Uncharacterized protein n=1 Tax=Guillardia theta (strain CCMP2712) TaxID=905079 RepID=L1JBT1_GUITC|nr:hypothetical protein GUITHDRAFT_163075 [Guillardia theta CCMP2712]EKX45998.1 hypothetical protein GUITHDRAFT_163075 [Guillardia theta CCMP2712]|eukprot:XP_005832978.1 hypothetical protein GUITHDRAFT_163075 [Guillardia theta CCMP2712]